MNLLITGTLLYVLRSQSLNSAGVVMEWGWFSQSEHLRFTQRGGAPAPQEEAYAFAVLVPETDGTRPISNQFGDAED